MARRHVWVMAGLLLVSGCATTNEDQVRAYNEHGVQLYGQGDARGALESFESALTLAPQDPQILYNVGQCHDRLGDWRRAEQYYLGCLQIAPNHADARHSLATVLYRTSRGPEANTMIEEWLRADPNRADALALDGWRLRQEKAFPQAQSRLQQALALEPSNRRALTELGIVYESINLPERALVLYERALASDPRQPELAQKLDQLKARGVKRPLPD